jgi:hypothetical protein
MRGYWQQAGKLSTGAKTAGTTQKDFALGLSASCIFAAKAGLPGRRSTAYI